MKYILQREPFIDVLQMACGIVEKRPNLPIISNILLEFKDNYLLVTGTDCEIELIARMTLNEKVAPFSITLPARKLFDSVRSLPEGSMITLSFDPPRCTLHSAKTRFTLSTLPSEDFPNVEIGPSNFEFSIKENILKDLLISTSFSMAQQDVRHYLNGMLFEVGKEGLRTVSADGHRLATATLLGLSQDQFCQVIIPRKGVTELFRILNDEDREISVLVCQHHIRFVSERYTFISKLIDGRYPDHKKVLPLNPDKIVIANREHLKQSLQRVSILLNEKVNGIWIQLSSGKLKFIAHNSEQDEVEDEMLVDYEGKDLEIHLNVKYLLDVMNALNEAEQIKLQLADANTSVLIESATPLKNKIEKLYIVMPMKG